MIEKKNKIFIIGYSGHAFVVIDILESKDLKVYGYFDKIEKAFNPYSLDYLGNENTESAMQVFDSSSWFVAIGDNHIRQKITFSLLDKGIQPPMTIYHKKSTISDTASFGHGTMVASGAIVNPLAKVGNGVICNTGSIIEHECQVGDFCHIAPGAVLAGNVQIGERAFVGANSVIKQGIRIGSNVTIGAGTVVLFDVPDGATIIGNPGRIKPK